MKKVSNKLITECPHVDKKHYAKVIIILPRICVIIAITLEEGKKKPGDVLIQTNSITP